MELSPDFMKMAQDGGKVVSLTNQPPLSPEITHGTHFLFKAESTPGPKCIRKGFMSIKNSIYTCLLTTRHVSVCAPRVARHTSIRYSRSCHTSVNMGASIFFTAAMVRAFRSARSRGTNTLHEMHVAQ